jgi:hypothetical protein
MPTRRRRLSWVVAVLAVAVAGCASPARNDQDYAAKAGHSAEVMVSIVQTARYATDLRLRGRIPQALADTVVSNAEQDAQSVLTAFDSRQPPDEQADHTRNSADSPLQAAGNSLTDLRVALRMQDHAQISQALDSLAATLPKLQTLSGGV